MFGATWQQEFQLALESMHFISSGHVLNNWLFESMENCILVV